MQGLKNKKGTPERSFLFLSQNDITGTRRKAIPFQDTKPLMKMRGFFVYIPFMINFIVIAIYFETAL